ncbi:alpha/beta hydrolase fold [Ruminococcus flavefaciens]|uniref:Alpha/beta hydrolase fold n=1 Tax=Ruminococcus flavefaciens TaxID=1265 RepID=A0A1H6JYM9_RUMFL|nr:alpha/beta hydrolase [Ruminococcus flavefaciens]SEH64490.1 alpha/beta hydrolase fold [Ruminococcus flavefaciens]
MKKFLKTLLKIFKWIGISILSLIIILLIVRLIGKLYYNRTPDGGINESMYIEVNGQEQWVSIYGENKDNPVMLFLHGGPGDSYSYADFKIWRKLAKDYTVINWDQRNAGKTWLHDAQNSEITSKLMRSDLEVMVDKLLEYTSKDSLTLLGMSWGTLYADDYALRHPEKVECVIDISIASDAGIYTEQMRQDARDYCDGVFSYEAAIAKYGYDFFFSATGKKLGITEPSDMTMLNEGMKQVCLEWTENDPELYALAEQLDTELLTQIQLDPDNKELLEAYTERIFPIYSKILAKYGGQLHFGVQESIFDADIGVLSSLWCNPYYSLPELYKILTYDYENNSYSDRIDMLLKDFSQTLKDNTEYQMPFYVLQGDHDDPLGIIRNYYDNITALDKDFRYLENGGHKSTLLRSKELAQFIHEVAERQKN